MDKIVDIATVNDYNAYWGVGRRIKKLKRMWQNFDTSSLGVWLPATTVSRLHRPWCP